MTKYLAFGFISGWIIGIGMTLIMKTPAALLIFLSVGFCTIISGIVGLYEKSNK